MTKGDVLSPLLFNIYINMIPLFQEDNSAPPKLKENTIGCLMYADDLVIVSASAEGLQNSLDILEAYCNKWKLQINISKSKTMCLNKVGRGTKCNFTIGQQELEHTKSYPYLGIEVSNSFSFKAIQQNLHKKAMRALFKLKTLVRGTCLLPKVIIKLFDQLIKPIALYGSEIWGIDSINPTDMSKMIESLEPPLCEKLNISLSRFALGVHKSKYQHVEYVVK